MDSDSTFLFDCCILAVGADTDAAVAGKLKEEILKYKLPKNTHSVEKSFKRISVLSVPASGEFPEKGNHMGIACQSRWLVIICSHATKSSPFLSEILLAFSNLGRKEYILPVLLQGEPRASFPDTFFEEREIRYADENGTEQIIREVIEPLAVDIRAPSENESLRALRHLKIKVVAALIGVSYDTLEQRHLKRTRRRMATVASVLLAVPLLFGSLFTYMWLNSQHQIDVATKKTRLSKDLFTKMCSEYPGRFAAAPRGLPIIRELLLENLEKLKIAESAFVQDLDIDSLLVPEDGDDPHTSLLKAMVLRYTGKAGQALPLYEKAAAGFENGKVYIDSARAFLEYCPPETYPSGVCILSIDPSLTEKYGMKVGDVIVAVDGFNFRSMGQYDIYLDGVKAGKKVEITLLSPGPGGLAEKKRDVMREDLVFTSAEI